jgi:hypothetical protein
MPRCRASKNPLNDEDYALNDEQIADLKGLVEKLTDSLDANAMHSRTGPKSPKIMICAKAIRKP